MIIFNESIDLVVVEGFDEETDNITEETVYKIKKGEPIDAEIISPDGGELDGGEYVDIQFAKSGGVALGVRRASFMVIP